MHIPKVLIVGQPFNTNFGGGITLANLFGGWDTNKLAVVCTAHMFNNLNQDICDTYYLLGTEEYKWMFPFNFLQKKFTSGYVKLQVKNNEEHTAPATFMSKFRTKIINQYFYPFLEYAGLFHGISKITLSAKLCKWLDEYNPDIIYAQASSRETVNFCSLVKGYTKKPMIYHVMDDWPSTISQKGPFKNFWQKKIDSELKNLLNEATVLLSISNGMAKEYKKRYNRDFITFHNPIEINFWKSHQRKSYELATSPVILYAGRVGTGITVTLENMAAAVEKVNNELNTTVQFVLQTKEIPAWIQNYKYTVHKPMVSYSDLPKVFAEADLLYLPYDFSKESIRFIKYSMPTKAPEYMMSGTPIIVFGPAETTLVADARERKWANVITVNKTENLAEAIKSLITNPNERIALAKTAIEIAEEEYDSNKIRNRFKEIITAASL